MKEEGRRKKEEGRGLKDVDSDKARLWGSFPHFFCRPKSKRAICRVRGIKAPTLR